MQVLGNRVDVSLKHVPQEVASPPPQYVGGTGGGGVHRGYKAGGWRCIHKAAQTKDGLWPPQESCYLRGVQGLASELSVVSRSVLHTECHSVYRMPLSFTH